MIKSELLNRFSLALLGGAIGYLLGMLVKVLELPEWAQASGILFLIAGSFLADIQSVIAKDKGDKPCDTNFTTKKLTSL